VDHQNHKQINVGSSTGRRQITGGPSNIMNKPWVVLKKNMNESLVVQQDTMNTSSWVIKNHGRVIRGSSKDHEQAIVKPSRVMSKSPQSHQQRKTASWANHPWIIKRS